MKVIGKIFFTGVFTVVPVVATIYLVIWVISAIEGFLGRQLKLLIPDELYHAGMGLLFGVVLICSRTADASVVLPPDHQAGGTRPARYPGDQDRLQVAEGFLRPVLGRPDRRTAAGCVGPAARFAD